MGFYTITPKEIEQNFNVKHEEITEYFKCLARKSYSNDISLYPSSFNRLVTAYKNGRECFAEKLK